MCVYIAHLPNLSAYDLLYSFGLSNVFWGFVGRVLPRWGVCCGLQASLSLARVVSRHIYPPKCGQSEMD